MAELTRNPWDLKPCMLTGGGPMDGSSMSCAIDRTLIRVPVIEVFGPDGRYAGAQESQRWVHAYVRLDTGVFAYDGIRER